MILKMNNIQLVEDRYGNHIEIKMITAYDDDKKYIKHVKITDEIVSILKDTTITGPFELINGAIKDKSYD